MNIWLLQSSEPMPVVNKEQRLLRTGMMAEKLNINFSKTLQDALMEKVLKNSRN